MMALAKRLLIDAIFAAIFARFGGALRWVFFLFGAVFVYGIVSHAVSDFRAHGIGRDVDLDQIEVSTQVDYHLGQIYWNVKNNTERVVGGIEITCTANGNELVIAPDEYIETGRSVSGVYRNSDIGYDSVCKLTRAMGYRT